MNIFGKIDTPSPLAKEEKKKKLDAVAQLLEKDPVLRKAFEQEYHNAAGVIDADRPTVKNTRGFSVNEASSEAGNLNALKSRIVDELLSLSDRKLDLLLPDESVHAVSNKDIDRFPCEVRP